MNRSTKVKCSAFLEFVRSKPCLVSHNHVGQSECHHLVARGWRDAKRNDMTGIPLCRAAHVEIEQIGVEKFEKKYHVQVWTELSWLLIEFFINEDRRREAVIDVSDRLGAGS